MHTTLERPAGRGRTEAPPPAARTALAEWRAVALRALFPLSFSRGASPAALARAVAIHEHLAGAQTFAELERRIGDARASLERPL